MVMENRKEDSENMSKFQGMLITCIFAAILVFIAPSIILMMMGTQIPSGETAEDVLFRPPQGTFIDDKGNATSGALLPASVTGGLNNLFTLVMWVIKIVLIMGILASVIMLRVRALPAPAAGCRD